MAARARELLCLAGTDERTLSASRGCCCSCAPWRWLGSSSSCLRATRHPRHLPAAPAHARRSAGCPARWVDGGHERMGWMSGDQGGKWPLVASIPPPHAPPCAAAARSGHKSSAASRTRPASQPARRGAEGREVEGWRERSRRRQGPHHSARPRRRQAASSPRPPPTNAPSSCAPARGSAP